MQEALIKDQKIKRCWWCGTDPLYVAYHDREWGIPEHDDLKLFEMLNLEGFQAGLSWITILRKRENFRKAFKGFNPEKIARFTAKDVHRLMNDEGIVRNRLKIEGAIINAKLFLDIVERGETFDEYLWKFTNFKTIDNKPASRSDLKATSKESDAMSKSLKKEGFKFVGSTICYAHMQATGMINDHIRGCINRSRA